MAHTGQALELLLLGSDVLQISEMALTFHRDGQVDALFRIVLALRSSRTSVSHFLIRSASSVMIPNLNSPSIWVFSSWKDDSAPAILTAQTPLPQHLMTHNS